jgi:hypothetical protein
MTLRTAIILTALLFLGANLNKLCAQTDRWYVLKSIAPMSESEVKLIISNVISSANITTMWYNGDKSQTFGVRNANEVFWTQVISEMNAHGYFLADITNGRNHLTGDEASTSVYYQEALYCSIHAESCPEDYIAKLNQDEWNSLAEEARNYYLELGNYVIQVE